MPKMDMFALDGAIPADVALPTGALRFEALPLLGLPPGTPAPASLPARRIRCGYPEAEVFVLEGIDWCLRQQVTVINMSIGPARSSPLKTSETDPDPLHLAIQRASERGAVVVVAAGNYGPKQDTLQFLARSPWAIPVGATDADGKLLDSSSRGVPGQSGPAVVADGAVVHPDETFHVPGTSFAAPIVSKVAGWLYVLIQLINQDLRDHFSGAWGLWTPINLPTVAYLDTGMREDAYNALHTAQPVSIARGDSQRAWYQRVLDVLDHQYGMVAHVKADLAGVRRSLQAIAKPLSGYREFEVGAGFISAGVLCDAVESFTPELFIRVFASDQERAAQIPRAELDALNSELGPLWDRAYVLVLREQILAGPGVFIVRVVQT